MVLNQNIILENSERLKQEFLAGRVEMTQDFQIRYIPYPVELKEYCHRLINNWLRNAPELNKWKFLDDRIGAVASSTQPNPAPSLKPLEQNSKKLDDESISKSIVKSLRGMVNTKWFTNTFPSDLSSFLEEERSKLKLFHGPTCSGKTEIAQRLAGMREGFPGLKDIGVDVHYLTGIESEIAVKDIVDKLKPLSVVLIDEADKFLNPKSPLYAEQSAHRFTNMIITLFERKPLYWVLIGTWDFLQEGDQSMDEKVSSLYGPEFGTRVDYDWRFPDWSLETLLEAIKASVPNRKVTYDDMSLAIMAQYCLKSGGGVRSFDNLEQRLIRKLKMKGDSTRVDESLVIECFKDWKYI
jgi:hypothetical protein